MIDLSQTIAPRSDQLNADDLIGGPRTITVSGVKRAASPDQPIAISFEGDGGKPFLPCKSMRRVLVQLWGNDGAAYAGRRMTIYRDDKVLFGGMEVGGIRISHLSDISREVTIALTVTKARRAPYTVKPLPNAPAAKPGQKSGRDRLYEAAREAAAGGSAALHKFRLGLTDQQDSALDAIQAELDGLATKADEQADGESEPAQYEEATPFDEAIEAGRQQVEA